MKTHKIITFGLIISVFISMFASCNVSNNTKNELKNLKTKEEVFDNSIKNSSDFALVADNANFSLYINGKTTNIKVLDKRSSKEWYSSPTNLGENNSNDYSAISVEYFNSSDIQNVYLSDRDAVKSGQFSFLNLENGIRVTYILGEVKRTFSIPNIITKSRMEGFLKKLDDFEQSTITSYYDLYNKNNAPDDIYQKYPIVKSQDIFVKSSTIPDFILEQIEQMFIKSGYTKEDIIKDNEQTGYKNDETETTITVSIDYTLTDDGFTAEIPEDGINHTSKINITKINFLKYFGAAGKNESGYIFVPDGSGALINLNNSKSRFEPYSKPVYGDDIVKSNIEEKKTKELQLFLPVFGMKIKNSAFFAIIEKGDVNSNINAIVSGGNNIFNTVNVSFEYNAFETIKFKAIADGSTKMNVYQKFPNSYGLKIKYLLLNGDNATYSGFANEYRKYLLKNNLISKKITNNNHSLNLTLLGASEYNSSFLGFPVVASLPLTTYSQAIRILKEIKQEGIDSINLKYKYATNNGIINTLFDNVKLISSLGSESDFKELIKYCADNNIKLYLNGEFTFLPKDEVFDAYSKNSDSAKNILNDPAFRYGYNFATYEKDLGLQKDAIIKPQKYNFYMTSFLKSYSKYNNKYLSVEGISNVLVSDFSKSSYTTRNNSVDEIDNAFKTIKSNGYSVMTQGTNAYTLKYSDSIDLMPSSSGGHYIIDEDVPFYQMVVHGLIDYSGEMLNYSTDIPTYVLKSIEYGSNINAEWIFAENRQIKKSNFVFNSDNYKIWLDEYIKYYKQILDVQKATKNQIIIKHEKIADKVYVTTYESGTEIYVNYRDNNFIGNGINISAKSFVIKEKG